LLNVAKFRAAREYARGTAKSSDAKTTRGGEADFD